MWDMSWMIISVVALSTIGLLVLGWAAMLVFQQVQSLARELDGAGRRLAGAARGLEQASVPIVRRAGSGAFSGGPRGSDQGRSAEAAPSGPLPFIQGSSDPA